MRPVDGERDALAAAEVLRDEPRGGAAALPEPGRGGERTGETVEAPGDAVDPVATSGPDTTWAPGGVAVDPASRSVLLTNLAGEQLLRFALADGDPARVAETETVLEGYGRLRAVVRGPDDCFYVTTSNRDGRGSPAAEDDRLLRLCPA